MIEIVAAVSAASGAFNTIKAGFAAGREIESMAGDLSRWMGAVSDIKKADEYNKKPPLFKKLFQAGSVEEVRRVLSEAGLPFEVIGEIVAEKSPLITI